MKPSENLVEPLTEAMELRFLNSPSQFWTSHLTKALYGVLYHHREPPRIIDDLPISYLSILWAPGWLQFPPKYSSRFAEMVVDMVHDKGSAHPFRTEFVVLAMEHYLSSIKSVGVGKGEIRVILQVSCKVMSLRKYNEDTAAVFAFIFLKLIQQLRMSPMDVFNVIQLVEEDRRIRLFSNVRPWTVLIVTLCRNLYLAHDPPAAEDDLHHRATDNNLTNGVAEVNDVSGVGAYVELVVRLASHHSILDGAALMALSWLLFLPQQQPRDLVKLILRRVYSNEWREGLDNLMQRESLYKIALCKMLKLIHSDSLKCIP
jgi:hypothetical protein